MHDPAESSADLRRPPPTIHRRPRRGRRDPLAPASARHAPAKRDGSAESVEDGRICVPFQAPSQLRKALVQTSPTYRLGQPIAPGVIDELHASAIKDSKEIQAVLARVCRERIPLSGARHRSDDPETAYLETVGSDSVSLSTKNFDKARKSSLLLNFFLDGLPYFFVCLPSSDCGVADRVVAPMPSRIYRAERRDRRRSRVDEGGAREVSIYSESGATLARGRVVDLSADGLQVELPTRGAQDLESSFRVEIHGEALRWAQLRRKSAAPTRAGWSRVGLSTSSVRPTDLYPVERRSSILQLPAGSRIRQKLSLAAAGASAVIRGALGRAKRTSERIEVVRYPNSRGEEIVAIVDSVGERRGATLVVIPPAWGRTKETLLPLAATILATFEKANVPVVVVRFDGVRKRGESHNDPECLTEGMENLHFSISEGVKDIQATVDYFSTSPEFATQTAILVSFSAASIEARRAVVADQTGLIKGWVSVVGAPDLQSGLKKVSGGLDFIGGAEQGLEFGIQELMGVTTDIDRVASDAIGNDLAFLEDSRREMAEIDVPITWIHGKFDAWLDLTRVREIMALGDTSRRKLLEVPTGHQLRSSQEAIEVFQLIAVEIGKMATEMELAPGLPDVSALELKRKAERARVGAPSINAVDFWRNYLLGRDGGLGIDLMNAIEPYQRLMDTQILALGLGSGDRVADVGAGTGAFPLRLLESGAPQGITVDLIDLVPEALKHARTRIEKVGTPHGVSLRYIECDLADTGVVSAGGFEGRYDALLASLFLSYVEEPEAQIKLMYRMLRPSGRLVLSTLRKDADISRLFVEGVRELRSGRASELLGSVGETAVDESLRRFLNDAARILDLEEAGRFHFWDEVELQEMVRRAGFSSVRTSGGFGDPPQAIVLSAIRPS